MAKEFFKDLPNTTTPLTASRLNGLLDGEEPMGNLVVDSIRSKNMFNIDACICGGMNNSTGQPEAFDLAQITSRNAKSGSITFETSYNWKGIISEYIEVEENKAYTISFTTTGNNMLYMAWFYDNNKNYLSNYVFTLGESITMPSNTKYVRFLLETTNATTLPATITLTNIQLEKGSSASTYTPYQGLDTSISFHVNVLIPNTTYTYATDLDVVYIKINKYVLLNVRNIAFKQYIDGNGIVLGTGLPKAKDYTIFYLNYNMGGGTTYDYPRVAINTNGELIMHWGVIAYYGESANKNYSGLVIYETTT